MFRETIFTFTTSHSKNHHKYSIVKIPKIGSNALVHHLLYSMNCFGINRGWHLPHPPLRSQQSHILRNEDVLLCFKLISTFHLHPHHIITWGERVLWTKSHLGNLRCHITNVTEHIDTIPLQPYFVSIETSHKGCKSYGKFSQSGRLQHISAHE